MGSVNQGAIYFDAGIGMEQWRRNIAEIRGDLAGISRTAEEQTSKIDGAFKNLSLGIAGYFSVSMFSGFIQQIIDIRGEFQKTEIAFATMLKSRDAAKSLMQDMVQLAAATPFSLREVSEGAKQLLAFQIPADEVVDTLRRMGDIAAGLGVPLGRIQLVYGQVKAKGKLMGDDLRQFTEAGIPMVAELAKKFGTTTAAISEMVSAGKIGFKDVQDVLFAMTNEGGMFFNLMEQQSASLSGRVSNLGDAFDQMLNQIGEANEGILYDGIEGLTYLVEHYKDVIQIIGTLVATYGTYRAALIAINAIQSIAKWTEMTVAAIRFAQGISGMTKAQLLFNAAAAANPYVLIAAGIAAVIGALVYFKTGTDEAKEATEEMTAAMEWAKDINEEAARQFEKGSQQTVNAINKEIVVLKSQFSTLEMRKKAYTALIGLNREFVGTVDSEYRAIKSLDDVYARLVGSLKEVAIAKGQAKVFEKLGEQLAAVQIQKVTAGEEYLKQQQENWAKQARNAQRMAEATRLGGSGRNGYNELSGDQYLKAADAMEQMQYDKYNAMKVLNGKEEALNKQMQAAGDYRIKNITKLNKELKSGYSDGKKLTDDEIKHKKEALKYFEGRSDEEVATTAKQGWAEKLKDQIKQLDEAIDKAPTKQLAAKYAAKKAALQKELSSIEPEKTKKDNKQLAEIYPEGSIKDLERRIQLYNDAMEVAVNNEVKLRKLDKYGNDKDKNGNAYLTGETVSIQEAKNRVTTLQKQLDAQKKLLQVRSFDEELAETERQWKIRYQIALHYGEEVAKAQFPTLKGDNYYDEINKMFKPLDEKQKTGVQLSDEELSNWSKLKGILDGMNGIKDPFTKFKDEISENLDRFETFSEKVDYLNKKLYNLSGDEIANGYKAEIYNQLESVNKELQNVYETFLKEQETYEQKKGVISSKYEEIRKKINANTGIDEVERKRLLDAAAKAEAKEYSAAFIDEFKKGDLWEKAFGDLDRQSTKALIKLKNALKETLNANKGNLSILDIKILQEQIDAIEEKISTKNPFKGISIAVDKYKVKLAELKKAQSDPDVTGEKLAQLTDETEMAFTDIVQACGDAAVGMIDFVQAIGDAFGGLSDELSQVLNEVKNLIKGIVDVVVGYFSGDWGKMVSGIVQIVGALVKLLNGDKKKERHIKEWAAEVENLKTKYDALLDVMKDIAGNDHIEYQRKLIANLQEQQRILRQMAQEEGNKKKSDKSKIADYNSQIQSINAQINDLIRDFKANVTSTDFKSFSEEISDALISAFQNGEDAAAAFDKAVDNVMRNAVANALRMKILEPVVQQMVDKLYNSMGYGSANATNIQNQINDATNQLNDVTNQLNNGSLSIGQRLQLLAKRAQLKALINQLQAQLQNASMGGSFDGLTQEERDEIKAMGENAMAQYMAALQQYSDLFGNAQEDAEGLKGAIKGVSEKTAGILEAQINAMRINQVEILKLKQLSYQIDQKALILLGQIEENTRPILWIYEKLKKVIP